MKWTAIAAVSALTLAGCTVSTGRAIETIEAQGYKDVSLGGNSWFGCSDKDTFTRTFTATAVNGSRVEGVICSGFFKGATVRTTKVIR